MNQNAIEMGRLQKGRLIESLRYVPSLLGDSSELAYSLADHPLNYNYS